MAINYKDRDKGREIVEYIDNYVGSRVRMRRLLLGLSQEEVGKRIGIDAEQVRKYERGVSKIYGAILYRFGKCLNVPISYFFEKVEDVMTQNLSSENINLLINEREVLPLVKAYQGISDIPDRQKVSNLMMLFAG